MQSGLLSDLIFTPLPGAPSGNGSSPTTTRSASSSTSSAITAGSGSNSTFPPNLCLSISDVSFHCRWRIISQNYIACHDDHRNDGCPHVLAVISQFSMALDALNVSIVAKIVLVLIHTNGLWVGMSSDLHSYVCSCESIICYKHHVPFGTWEHHTK